MRKLISAKLAGVLLLAFMILLVIFHLHVMFKVIPADMVLGGQIKDPASNMLMMELIALFVTLVLF